MTTRQGTAYKQMEELQNQEERRGSRQEEGGRDSQEERRRSTFQGGRDGASMAEMVQILMEDRRRRETELAEERRLWEEERRRRELEFEEERRRQQAETARREEQTLQQMQLLQSLVEGVHLQGEAARQRAEGSKEVKVPKLSEQDDIVSTSPCLRDL